MFLDLRPALPFAEDTAQFLRLCLCSRWDPSALADIKRARPSAAVEWDKLTVYAADARFCQHCGARIA